MDNSELEFKQSLRGGEYIPTHPPKSSNVTKSMGGTAPNTDRYIFIPKELQHLKEKPTLRLKIVLE